MHISFNFSEGISKITLTPTTQTEKNLLNLCLMGAEVKAHIIVEDNDAWSFRVEPSANKALPPQKPNNFPKAQCP